MNSAKKRRIDLDGQRHKVTIAQYNDNDTSTNDETFDRSHPHLEGRWVGHIHLPLPSFESLDLLQQVDCNEGQEGAPNHDEQSDTSAATLDVQTNGQSSDNENSSSDSSSSEEEDDDMPQSRMFLPIARQLIHQWAKVLRDSPSDEDTASDTVIVPLIPMDRTTTPSKKDTSCKSKSSINKQDASTSASQLHISLSRPIYLPTPSVDPFLSDIQKNLSAVINTTNSRRRGGQSNGKILNLQPQNTLLLTNDTSTRTFLSIPISISSSNWIKKSILPIVDATMLKFGLLSYYNDNNDNVEEENGKGKDGKGGCIVHVSIASIRGNVIPQMLLNRNNNNNNQKNNSNGGGDVEKIRSILLFTSNEQEDITEEKMEELSAMPSYIPIRVNCIQCEFGKTKKLSIPL